MEKEKIIIESELSGMFKMITLIIGIISLVICFVVNGYMTYYIYNIIIWSVFVTILVVLMVLNVLFSGVKIVVTDKRVYGKNILRKRVDLPLDSITTVATVFLKGLAVATSSGRIVFVGLSNRDNLHKAISNLIIDRQSSQKTVVEKFVQQNESAADELKKFKELLDTGIISKEEFEEKKKQLLRL